MTRNRLVAVALVVALAMMMGFKCYRQVTMSDRKLEEALKLKSAGKFDDARGLLVDAMKTGADRAMCLSMISECDIALNDPHAAIQTCEELRKIPGSEWKAHAMRGAAFELQGEFVSAMAEYEASAGLHNTTAEGSMKRLRKKMAH